MPKVSKESAAQVEQHGPVEDRHEDVEGYTINFLRFDVDMDSTPLLKGLPEDNCNCPHWGYVLKGRVTFRFPDHDDEDLPENQAHASAPTLMPRPIFAAPRSDAARFPRSLSARISSSDISRRLRDARIFPSHFRCLRAARWRKTPSERSTRRGRPPR